MWSKDDNKVTAQKHVTLISTQSTITGDVYFTGGLQVDGKIIGNIVAEDDSKAIVRISDKGMVEGEIRAPNVIVNGKVVGNVHSCDHVELAAKAVIEGNVFYNLIEMVMGAQVNGSLLHNSDADKGKKKKMPSSLDKPVTGLAASTAGKSIS